MHPDTLTDRIRIATGGRTVREVADAIGMHHETVRRYLQGHTPSADFLARICEVYRVPGTWLLLGKGPCSEVEARRAALATAPQSDLLGSLALRLMAMETRIQQLEALIGNAEAVGVAATPTRRVARPAGTQG